MKIAKKISLGIFTVIVASLVLLSVMLGFMDWNEYRSTLAKIASDGSGLKVELDGTVSMSLFPSPQISAETVSLSPQSADVTRPFATADKIDLKISLFSLLRGDISFERLDLDGLELTVAENSEGGWWIEGWPAAEDTGPSEASGRGLGFDSLRVENARITVAQANTARRQLIIPTLDFVGSLPKGPLDWDGEFLLDGEQVKTMGRLRPVKVRDAISLRAEFDVSGGSLILSGRLDPDGALTGRVEGQGTDIISYANTLGFLATANRAFESGPKKPFKFDVQVGGQRSLIEVDTRELLIGDTRGRFELAIAVMDRASITGAVSLGVIKADAWQGLTFAPSEEENFDFPFSATVDLDIEGIENARGVTQHIGASVTVTGSDVTVQKIQAMLPGGSTLTAGATFSSSNDFDGTYRLDSGNLPALLRWLDIDLNDKIATGRLATASVSGQLLSGPAGWQFAVTEGKVDTTRFAGTMSGPRGIYRPEKIFVSIADLNVDAYQTGSAANSKAGGTGRETIAQQLDKLLIDTDDLALSVEATNLFWQSESIRKVNFDADVKRSGLAVRNLTASMGQGVLKLEASADKSTGAWTLDTSGSLQNVPVSFVTAFAKDSSAHLQALNVSALNGSFSVRGQLSDMRVTADFTAPGNALSASGTVAVAGQSLSSYAIQGNIQHGDLSDILKANDITLYQPVAIEAAYSLEKTGSAADTSFRLGGKLAGGQVQISGSGTENTLTAKMSVDHPNAGYLSDLLGTGIFPTPDQPATIEANIKKTGDVLSLSDIIMRNAGTSLTGHVDVAANNTIKGRARLAGLTIDATKSSEPSAKTLTDTEISFPWQDAAGTLAIELQDISIFGQKVAAPSAQAILGDGVMRITLGDDASLNGGRLRGQVDLLSDAVPSFHVTVDATQFDLASLLLGGGLKPVINGGGSVRLDLGGKGRTLRDMKQSLTGEGQIEGFAGTLNFLSVPSIVQTMTTADTATGFLKSIGTHFRQGQTSVNKFNASFTMDGGVALFETLDAFGDWGSLTLDGQVNLADDLLNLKGLLELVKPQDTPAIPVSYTGSLSAPATDWQSRLFEKFVIADIERRFRSVVFQELEQKQKTTGGTQQSPGSAVFGRALELLNKIQKKPEKDAAETETNN
ncbi:AsmA family protein [Kordiimonas sediminis]|uniref:AsmA family protein n=1 Tax=Kordiimonas sediminis TaxID=1735581 RepID=UPI00174BBD33|nr:AsmA family protein [Kordiimonas sediminis]